MVKNFRSSALYLFGGLASLYSRG